jgi:hypothetical protein
LSSASCSGRARAEQAARHQPDRRARQARPAEGELVGEQFLHWFLQEQREEVSSMTELLQIVERGKDNLLQVEEYLSREAGGENPLEAGAPPAAGGAL